MGYVWDLADTYRWLDSRTFMTRIKWGEYHNDWYTWQYWGIKTDTKGKQLELIF